LLKGLVSHCNPWYNLFEELPHVSTSAKKFRSSDYASKRFKIYLITHHALVFGSNSDSAVRNNVFVASKICSYLSDYANVRLATSLSTRESRRASAKYTG
jgi:hypothetical protein